MDFTDLLVLVCFVFPGCATDNNLRRAGNGSVCVCVFVCEVTVLQCKSLIHQKLPVAGKPSFTPLTRHNTHPSAANSRVRTWFQRFSPGHHVWRQEVRSDDDTNLIKGRWSEDAASVLPALLGHHRVPPACGAECLLVRFTDGCWCKDRFKLWRMSITLKYMHIFVLGRKINSQIRLNVCVGSFYNITSVGVNVSS